MHRLKALARGTTARAPGPASPLVCHVQDVLLTRGGGVPGLEARQCFCSYFGPSTCMGGYFRRATPEYGRTGLAY
jgi:hypothetical protein